MKSIGAIKKKAEKKRGRGHPPTGIGKAIGLRLYPDIDTALVAYIADADDAPSLPEAIRRLLRSHPDLKRYLEGWK